MRVMHSEEILWQMLTVRSSATQIHLLSSYRWPVPPADKGFELHVWKKSCKHCGMPAEQARVRKVIVKEMDVQPLQFVEDTQVEAAFCYE